MRSALLFISVMFCIALPAQSYSNYQYAKDRQVVPSDDWSSGSRSFTVTSDVILYVQPDGWVIELQGTEEAATLTQTRTTIQSRADAFAKKLNALGIPPENITITTASQERISGWKKDTKEISTYTTVGYSITKNILIRYTNVEDYSRILTAGSEKGFDKVTKNYCTVGDEQQVYAELYRQAMEVALQKQQQQAESSHATVVPGGTVSAERYNAQSPQPGVYVHPGVQRQPLTGYDRAIGSEYGNGAVRYTVHLEYTFTLQKPSTTEPSGGIKHY